MIEAERISANKSVVYACTHIGRYDVESDFLSLKNHFFGGSREALMVYCLNGGKLLIYL